MKMKRIKKLSNVKASEKFYYKEVDKMFYFTEMLDYVYVRKNSRLIGENADKIKDKFCIEYIVYYDPIKIEKEYNNVISPDNTTELKGDMKLTQGHLLIIGEWGGITEFEKTYNLNGKLRKSKFI